MFQKLKSLVVFLKTIVKIIYIQEKQRIIKLQSYSKYISMETFWQNNNDNSHLWLNWSDLMYCPTTSHPTTVQILQDMSKFWSAVV